MQPVTPGNMRETQEVCMQVVAHACGDSVLKVFLAALVREWLSTHCQFGYNFVIVAC